MNDAEYRKEKARVEKLLKGWTNDLGLRWWRLKLTYFRAELPPYEGETRAETSPAAMDCKADWRYTRATIRVNLLATADMNDDDLEWAVVHECSHVFLNEMRDGGIEHEERVASTLASAFIWLRDAAKGAKPNNPRMRNA